MSGPAERSRLPGLPAPTRTWEGVAGVRLAGDAWGDSSNRLVMLLHGGGQTRHAWKNTGEHLAREGYHVIAYDARGHGDSDWSPDGDYGMDVSAGDLACVLAQTDHARPAVLVGASMGGGAALVAIGDQLVEAAALVLVDVAPRVEPDGVAKIDAFMAQRPDGFDTLEEVADAIAAYQPHRPRPRQLDGLAKNVRVDADGRYRWHWDPAVRPDAGAIERHQLRFEEAARRLSVPTLIVRGGLSNVLSEDGVREFLDLYPEAQHVTVSDAAHMVAGDRNDIFATAVLEFILSVAPPVLRPASGPSDTGTA